MSLRTTLAKALVFAILQFGAAAGAPVTPEEIERLMNLMHRTKVVHVLKREKPK